MNCVGGDYDTTGEKILSNSGGINMIEFAKEAGMAVLWLFLGYLLGERSKNK